MNKHIIDDFIDEYWVLNCPESYSVTEINDQIYKFFHQMLTLDKEITVQQQTEIERLRKKIDKITMKIKNRD